MDALELRKKIYEELEKKSHMVLGTCADNRVTTRNVSTIFMNGKIYFQTDTQFMKYIQITKNQNVSLCESNIQAEGVAKVLGHPSEEHNKNFLDMFSQKHKGSFERYTYLPNEIVIEVTPTLIQMWAYENDRPYIYNLNLENNDYSRRDYPMNHNMKLSAIPFERMKNGMKTIEYRLNDEKRQLLRIGDTILFAKLPNLDEHLLTEVIEIQNYKTFYDAFKELYEHPNSDIGDDLEKAATSMSEYYSQEKEEQYKTLAIKVKLIRHDKSL